MLLILIAEMNHIVSVAMEIDCIYTAEQEEVESEEDVSP